MSCTESGFTVGHAGGNFGVQWLCTPIYLSGLIVSIKLCVLISLTQYIYVFAGNKVTI